MAERLCPVHGTALESRGRLFHCAQCAADYRISGRCAECGSELEHVAACGASNWWCNTCNELKSKSRVTTELVRA